MLNIFASVEKKIEQVCNVSGDAREMHKILKRTGVNINMIALDGGWTAMHVAAMHGFVDLLNYLITEAGGNPSILATTDLLTPLHVGCWKGHIEVVRLLLKRGGVDLDCQTKDGLTPLHFACWHGYFAICELLIQAGASATMVNNVGQTPFMVAARFGRELIVDLFLKTQSAAVQATLLNGVDHNGCTALSHACYEGRESCASLLLKRGADALVVDSHGRGLLKYCRQNTSRVLLRHMESVHRLNEPAAEDRKEEEEDNDDDDDDDSRSDDSNYQGDVRTQSFSYPQPSPPATPHTLPPSHPTPSLHRTRSHSATAAPPPHPSHTQDTEVLLGAEGPEPGDPPGPASFPSRLSPVVDLRGGRDGTPEDDGDHDEYEDLEEDDDSLSPKPGREAHSRPSRIDHLWTLASGRVQALDIVRDLWGLCGDETHPMNQPVVHSATSKAFSEEERAIKLFLLLRKHAVPINQLRDRNGCPPLMVALLHDLLLPAQVLLYYHADIFLVDGEHANTVAHACAHTGHASGLRLLYDYLQRDCTPRLDFLRDYLHVDVTHTLPRTPSEQRLLDCLAGKAPCVSRAYTSLGDVFDRVNAAQRTPLLLAAAANRLDIVRFLVETVHVDIFAQDVHGHNVLHVCVAGGHLAIAVYLLRLHRSSDEDDLSTTTVLLTSSDDHRRWIDTQCPGQRRPTPSRIRYHPRALLCELSRTGHLPADLTRDPLARRYLCAVQALALAEGREGVGVGVHPRRAHAHPSPAARREVADKRRLVEALEAAVLGEAPRGTSSYTSSPVTREREGEGEGGGMGASRKRSPDKSPGRVPRREPRGRGGGGAPSQGGAPPPPGKEVAEVFREKLRDQLGRFPSPPKTRGGRSSPPRPLRSPPGPSSGGETASPPRQYAFMRYYQKRYHAGTTTPSEGRGSPRRQDVRATAPVVRVPARPDPPYTPATRPASPPRAFPVHGLRGVPEAGSPGQEVSFGLQVFLGSLSRILDYRHHGVKRCFYRWKHRASGRGTAGTGPPGSSSSSSGGGGAGGGGGGSPVRKRGAAPVSVAPAASPPSPAACSPGRSPNPWVVQPCLHDLLESFEAHLQVQASPTPVPTPVFFSEAQKARLQSFYGSPAQNPPRTPSIREEDINDDDDDDNGDDPVRIHRMLSELDEPPDDDDDEGDHDSTHCMLSEQNEPGEDGVSRDEQWTQDLHAAVMTACWMSADGRETSGGTRELLPLVAANVRTLWEIFWSFASHRGASLPLPPPPTSRMREGDERHPPESVLTHYMDPLLSLDALLHLLASFDLFPRLCTRHRLLALVQQLAPHVPQPQASARTSPSRTPPSSSASPLLRRRPPPSGGLKDPPPPSDCLSFLDFLKVLVALSQDLQVQGSAFRFTLLLHSMESSTGRERMTRTQREARIVPALHMARVPSAVWAKNMAFTHRK